MVGRRLNLWRLRNFHVTRIEAPEDVLLYECVARENPADRRLVALAQVRQLAVVRDEAGNVAALPHAERAVENCLEAIRRARVARGAAGAKLDMNHVWVQVWPVVDVDVVGPDRPRQTRSARSPTARASRRSSPRAGSPTGGEPMPVAVRFSAQPGAGVVSSVEEPPTELLGAARRLRRQGAAGAAARPGLPLRAGVGAHRTRTGRWSSTTSTTPASWCRSTGRAA